MKELITLITLFFIPDKPLSQETRAQEAASAYAFLIDSVIIKEFQEYGHVKDPRITVWPMKEFQSSNDQFSSFWKQLKLYYGNPTDIRFMDSLVSSSESFNIKKVKNYSAYAGIISILDSSTSPSYLELLRLSGIKNTSVFSMSNAVFTQDRKHCIIFYHQFQGGGTTIVLKRNNTKWEIAYKNMDWIE